MTSKERQILEQGRQVLRAVAPDARILLYGSHARGDNNADSDWDLLVVMPRKKVELSEYEAISNPVYELGWQLGELFSVKIYSNEEWEKRYFTPFYKNVERDAIVL
jgi:predicted nucleotidyltransferase